MYVCSSYIENWYLQESRSEYFSRCSIFNFNHNDLIIFDSLGVWRHVIIMRPDMWSVFVAKLWFCIMVQARCKSNSQHAYKHRYFYLANVRVHCSNNNLKDCDVSLDVVMLILDHLVITYWLIPWSSVILEKLTGSQLVKQLPALYGTWRNVTAITSARQQSLSWARSILSMPSNKFPEDPPSYDPPIYAWVLQVVSFPQASPPKTFIHLSSFPYVLRAPPISFFSMWSPK
jgi:hypothetical protein